MCVHLCGYVHYGLVCVRMCGSVFVFVNRSNAFEADVVSCLSLSVPVISELWSVWFNRLFWLLWSK